MELKLANTQFTHKRNLQCRVVVVFKFSISRLSKKLYFHFPAGSVSINGTRLCINSNVVRFAGVIKFCETVFTESVQIG